ncbi:Crp/Fnr family transcriptional regulator [Variovorax terrae]|uniref:Crp/Fnr family transcriptional regulator n=1 Tax=Variovorax terrae TaxID=2923278 RepID=A0A9X1W078_9BURK|nr:Crp/Fnr family transcriptional regulator [Variovorax terrae]MCJ0766185.1 Crp/Fnr family transcriptional regulator [Variovorax terrae]
METSADINWSSALRGLSESEIRRIEGCLTRREVAARSPIFHQGESADALYIVQAGRVRLIRRTEGGEEFTTGIWSEGYLIGLISAFLGEKRFLAAETVESATLRVFQRSALHGCMEAIPRFALNIANLLALLASESIQRAAPLALESVGAKLGRVLVKLAVPDDSGRGHVVRGITQDELGSMVGASRPWVNRALAAFEKRGLIQRHKQLISILDIAACRRLWMD